MGADISGLQPSSPSGEYIRFNVSRWFPLCLVIREGYPDLYSAIEGGSLFSNSGQGLRKQEDCDKLADRLERDLERGSLLEALEAATHFDFTSDPESKWIETFMTFIDHELPTMLEEEGEENVDVPKFMFEAPDEDHIRRFIRFLRTCGGFKVD